MSFPETERVVFAENPLDEVICQFRFPPILAIASEPPAGFQDLIRVRYPNYERADAGQAFPPEVAAVLAEFPIQSPIERITHRFATAEGRFAIALTTEWLAVSTNDYTDWGSFRAEVELAKQALEETYEPAFYVRVGLRYRDIVDREQLGLQEVPWSDLLNPVLLGTLGAEETLREGVRTVRGESLITLDTPSGGQVRLLYGLNDDTGMRYGVDGDWFYAERSELGDALQVLDDFNRQAGNLFRWAIQDRLRHALGSRESESVGQANSA
jgi:uncharacterized protein (TIGR04255 family)